MSRARVRKTLLYSEEVGPRGGARGPLTRMLRVFCALAHVAQFALSLHLCNEVLLYFFVFYVLD